MTNRYPLIKRDPTALTAKEIGQMSLPDALAYWKLRDPAFYAACTREFPSIKKVTKNTNNFMELSLGENK